MSTFKKECFEQVKNIAAEINALAENEDSEKFYEYFEDVLDVEYRTYNNLDYKGAYIYLSLGGPNVWVDTIAGSVELAWGTDRAIAYLNEDVVNMIDDYFEELFNCQKG